MTSEILTVAEIAAADRAAIAAGTSGFTLMQRAGRAVAEAVMARFERQPLTVLCGPGNNGGDGYAAAAILAEAGWPVRIAGTDRAALKGDAAEVAKDWRGEVQPLTVAAAQDAGLVIDAPVWRRAKAAVVAGTAGGAEGRGGAVGGGRPAVGPRR